LISRTAFVGSVSLSYVMICTGRPSIPPALWSWDWSIVAVSFSGLPSELAGP